MLTRRYFPRVTAGETSCNTLKELLDLMYFRTIKSLVHLLITDLSKSKSIEILNRLSEHVRITLEPNSCIVGCTDS